MKNVTFGFLFVILVVSCSKEKENFKTGDPINYTPMEVGNYWVYGNFHIDVLGNESQTSRIDSVSITGKKTIRGNSYFVFEGTYYFTQQGENSVLWMLRDSSGYIVDTNGRVIFDQYKFTIDLKVYCQINTPRIDTAFCYTYQTKRPIDPISVPAGSFETLNYQRIITMHDDYTQSNVPNPREWNTLYANGVGKILETYFFVFQADYFELRLLRYKLK